MKTKEYDSLQSLITHQNRYKLLYDKFSENTNTAVEKGTAPTYEELIERLEIMDQMIETLGDIASDHHSIIKEMEIIRNISQTALKIYAKVYGNELVVPEGFENFGEKFQMKVHVIPRVGETTVTIELEEEE